MLSGTGKQIRWVQNNAEWQCFHKQQYEVQVITHYGRRAKGIYFLVRQAIMHKARVLESLHKLHYCPI
jgi:hypothetical protein